MATVHPTDLVMLESVEAAHSSHSVNSRVSQILGIEEAPCRMDSQAKYCALALGRGHLYLRMPTRSDYQEKIWDHAPGMLLVEEAGGVVSDSRGEALDFSQGRTLGTNYGVLASSRWVHPFVIEAVQQAVSENEKANERAKRKEAKAAAAELRERKEKESEKENTRV